MSYIIPSTSPFVSIKLTDIGRNKLAQGQLNFSYWAIGDSEIDYNREQLVNANQSDLTLSATSKVFRTFDLQPNIKSFITPVGGSNLNALTPANINVVQATVNNQATERGFFVNNGTNYTTQINSPYTLSVISIPNSTITGGTSIVIPYGSILTVSSFIRLNLNTNISTTASGIDNTTPNVNLWYKIQNTGYTSTGSVLVTVDRALPNFSVYGGNSYMFVYPNGEVANTFGSTTSTAYWDSGTLSFDSATNITCSDVKVWNMNNVFTENLAGITGLSTTNLYENFTKFGSYTYTGTKNPYLEYLTQTNSTESQVNCNGTGYSYPDVISKSISIIHYTNNTISNLYGDFLFIDTTNNKLVNITLPDLMYHRANYSTASGTTMGMSFISSGATKTIGTSNIQYIPLIENPAYIGNSIPLVVGKVLPQLKIIVIDNDEIVAALSYKSNRSWTLPALSATLTQPVGTTGILGVDQTMYLTYALDNTSGSGFTATLPCQSYIKITNTTPSSMDVQFAINALNQFPYMRKLESTNYDGLGFYANKFKLVYQIVTDVNVRPDAGSWKTYDYTSTLLTSISGQTIDPKLLENQLPIANNFILTTAIGSASTIYDITQSLSMAPNTNNNILQFGDERFFYGNVQTYIGSNIYKTIFDISVNSAQFTTTTNPTRSTQLSTNPPPIEVTEVGIYDNNNNLVVIGKVSQPVQLTSNDTIMFELSLDF